MISPRTSHSVCGCRLGKPRRSRRENAKCSRVSSAMRCSSELPEQPVAWLMESTPHARADKGPLARAIEYLESPALA